MTVTLITHDGFVKQIAHPNPTWSPNLIRIAGETNRSRLANWQYDADDLFDVSRMVTYTVREFFREGHTSVFKER